MRKPLEGSAQPALSEHGQEEALKPKLRTYTTPNGCSFELTEEEFQEVVLIFSIFRQWRDDDVLLALESQGLTQQNETSPVNLKKVG
jgi:hypothetical protein